MAKMTLQCTGRGVAFSVNGVQSVAIWRGRYLDPFPISYVKMDCRFKWGRFLKLEF